MNRPALLVACLLAALLGAAYKLPVSQTVEVEVEQVSLMTRFTVSGPTITGRALLRTDGGEFIAKATPEMLALSTAGRVHLRVKAPLLGGERPRVSGLIEPMGALASR